MTDWAVLLDHVSSECLLPLRLIPGLQILQTETRFWLRGPAVNKETQSQIAALPGRRFSVLSDGQLLAFGQNVPDGYLPRGDWQTLKHWMEINRPTPAWAGANNQTEPLRLVRSSAERSVSLLLTNFAALQKFVLDAAAIRLQSLEFTIAESDASDNVLLRGSPLPTLRGRYFWMENNIAVPAGWTWQPAVDAEVVRRIFALRDEHAVVLWQPSETTDQSEWTLIPSDAFVPLTRANVRENANGVSVSTGGAS